MEKPDPWPAISRNAWPLPAIQPGYAKHSRDTYDFLSKHGAFHYPRALYSVGHAELDVNKAARSEPQIHRRDRRHTLILTDSGGYQIIYGNLDIWDNQGRLLNKPREDILRWMENTASVSLTMDVPLFAIDNDHLWAKSFNDCLNYTNDNLIFFAGNTTGEIPFINVVHGRTTNEARQWYHKVEWFDSIGWAFGGHLSIDLRSALAQIIYMRDDGAFKDKYFLHFLGRGSAFAAICLSQIQKSLGGSIRLTYDNASPFLAGGRFAEITPWLKADGPYKPLIEAKMWMGLKKKLGYLTYDEIIGYNVFMQLRMIEENCLAWEQGRISTKLKDVCDAIDCILTSSSPYTELSKLGPILPKLNIR